MLLAKQALSQAQTRLNRIGARVSGLVPVVAAGLFMLPIPLPGPDTSVLTTPVQRATSVLPTALPTLPASVDSAAPTVLPAGGPLPDLAPQTQTSAGVPGSTAPAAPITSSPAPSAGDGSRRGLPIPFTTIVVSSPLDVALIGAIAVLPLLLAIWLFLVARTFVEARRARDSQVRLTLAADLGLRPQELASMSTGGR
jgi:hypothetical protein